MRALRMLVISSGLICMSRFVAPWRRAQLGLRDLLAKLFEAVADRGVEDHVADAHHDAAEDRRGRPCSVSSTRRPVCSSIRLPIASP